MIKVITTLDFYDFKELNEDYDLGFNLQELDIIYDYCEEVASVGGFEEVMDVVDFLRFEVVSMSEKELAETYDILETEAYIKDIIMSKATLLGEYVDENDELHYVFTEF